MLGAQASKDLVAPSPSHLQGAELTPCCFPAPSRGKHSLGRGLASMHLGREGQARGLGTRGHRMSQRKQTAKQGGFLERPLRVPGSPS